MLRHVVEAGRLTILSQQLPESPRGALKRGALIQLHGDAQAIVLMRRSARNPRAQVSTLMSDHSSARLTPTHSRGAVNATLTDRCTRTPELNQRAPVATDALSTTVGSRRSISGSLNEAELLTWLECCRAAAGEFAGVFCGAAPWQEIW